MPTMTRKELASLGWRIDRDGKPVRLSPTEPRKPHEKVDGAYDSKLERDFALHLVYLQRVGEVHSFIHHPPPLSITSKNRYVCDFLICWENGRFEYAEVKGYERKGEAIKCQLVKDACANVMVCMWKRVKGLWVRREF